MGVGPSQRLTLGLRCFCFRAHLRLDSVLDRLDTEHTRNGFGQSLLKSLTLVSVLPFLKLKGLKGAIDV